jgi:hypothetical protein
MILPNSVTSIGHYAFSDCKNIDSITISNGLISIGNGTFVGCYSLTSIALPNSVTSIGELAFSGCKNLTSMTLSNSLKSIRDNTFYECCNLTSIILPNGLTSIGDYAFAGCENLFLITNLNPVPIAINPSVFARMPQFVCVLEVPMGSVSAYQNANVWKEFNIVGIEVGIDEELQVASCELQVYPNPTGGELVVSTEYRVESIEIFDLLGKLVFIVETGRAPSLQFDISHLPSGTYFVRIQTENGMITKKIIKN